MAGRPRGRYCYICERDGPCDLMAPCRQLPAAERKRAYQAGYQRAHPELCRQKSKDHYHKLHPQAPTRKPRAETPQRRETRLRSVLDKEAEHFARNTYWNWVRTTSLILPDREHGYRIRHNARRREKRAQRKVIRETARAEQRLLQRVWDLQFKIAWWVVQTAHRRAKWQAAEAELERRRQALRNLVLTIPVICEANGKKPRYASAEAFAVARKRYKKAHATIYARLHKSYAPHRKVRGSKMKSDACVKAFYKEVRHADSLRCQYCWRPLTPAKRVVDHIVPLAKGGAHIRQNLCCACIPCNSLKSDLTLKEFVQVAIQRLCA